MSTTVISLTSGGSGTGYAGFVLADNPTFPGPLGSITPNTVDGLTIGDIQWTFASHGNASVQVWLAYTGTPPPDWAISAVQFTGDGGVVFNLPFQGTDSTFLRTGLTGTLYKVWFFQGLNSPQQAQPFTNGSVYAITLITPRWENLTLPGYLGTVQWLKIAYGGGVFVAMGKDPTTGGLVLAHSTDTTTWTQVTGTFAAPYGVNSGADICYTPSNGFTIVGTDGYGSYNPGNTTIPVARSASGTSGWSVATPAISGLNYSGISPQPAWLFYASSFSSLVIYVIDNTFGGLYCTSNDGGVTWSSTGSTITGDHSSSMFGGFTDGNFSLVLKAKGSAWNVGGATHQTFNASGGAVRDSVAFSRVPNLWATIDTTHTVSSLWVSTDGTTWTAATGPLGGGGGAALSVTSPPLEITCIENLFGNPGTFYYSIGPDSASKYRLFSSQDLVVWTEEQATAGADLGAGHFVGVASDGNLKLVTPSLVTPGLLANIGTGAPVMVNVPNVVGDVLATGEAALVSAGLVTGTVTTAGSLTVAPGDIISSNPVAGTSVASGSSVDLVNSTGVAVPNVVNELLSAAMADIVAAGLTVGAVTTSTSISIVAGNIISSTPAAATAVAGGSSVALLDSIGLPTETIPNVVSEVLATGEAALVAAGLVTGTVTTSTSITIASGSIISQSLLGTALYGTAIDLVESTGLPTVPVPNVVGMPLATASATLVAHGFVSGTVTTATSITIPGGDIISQSVTGTALYGTTVNMVESSGLPTVSVPNVVGDTVAVATAALVAANLVLGVVSTGYSATIPNGEIMSQDVTGTALYGTPVDLVLSLGPPLIFPPVIGQNVADATVTLTGLGLTLGEVIEGVSEDFPIGIIYAYAPPGGVEPASTVDLFVSSLYLSPNGAKYASLITSEHNQKPKYMALVTFLCSVMADITAACAAIPAAFDLDLAVGNQLDIIGLWVGQPRVIQSILVTGFFGFEDDVEALPFGELTDPSKGGRWYELNEASTGTATLGDTAYRTLLKARIIRNQSDGTTPEIEASLADIFGAPCAITDAGTLSLAISVPVPITPEEEALVGPLDLLPRPAGVAIGSITYTG